MKFFTQMPEEKFKDRFEDYDEVTEQEYCDNHPLLNVDDAPVFKINQIFNVPYETGILTIMNILVLIAGIRIFANSSLMKR
jgi:hypothetical protein